MCSSTPGKKLAEGYAAALANFQEVGDRLNLATLQEALAGFREVGSKTSVANALENLAASVSGQADLEAARKMLKEALAIDYKQGRNVSWHFPPVNTMLP